MNPCPNLSKTIESFALDFVRLIRGVRVYPSKHPSLIGVAERVIASVHFDSAGLFTIGVTPTELIVSGAFIAGKATRLARILHARKVLRILWTQGVGLEDLWTFARLLSTPKLEGAELRRKLHSEGVYAIDLEPLDFEQIHRGVSDQVVNPKNSSEERRRTAWLMLMSHEAPPEQIASALSSEEFWENARACWTDAGYGDSEGFTDLLLRLKGRFEAALSLLPDSRRQEVFDYLAKMGKTLAIPELVRILAQEGRDPKGMGHGVVSLFRDMDGERFVDLLAGLAAGGDKSAGKVAEVYRHFNPGTGTDSLLSLVKSRISLGEGSGFAVEVWKTVEKLILELNENPFMGPEYSESLEHLVDLPVSEPEAKGQAELLQDPDDSLDKVILGLAMEGDERWLKKLLERIEARVEQAGVFRVLGLIRLVDEVRPELLDSMPVLVKRLFRRGLSDLTKATPFEREALAQFVLRHEGALLDPALKALAEEERICGRYFLVTLLSSFSSAATPAFVAKARSGPWYVTRNLAIVLGQQEVPCSVPALRALSNHDHPKVRREALRALRKLESSLNQGTDSNVLQTEESGHDQEMRHFLNRPVHMEPAEAYA